MKVLITGGASGLGYAVTRCLALRFPEAIVHFSYRSGKAEAAALEAELPNCRGVFCDFTDGASVDALSAYLVSAGIDVLVNNAIAQFKTGYAHKTAVDELQQSFQVNVVPTLKLTQAFLTTARRRKSGRIITILSAAIDEAATGWSVYRAEKMYLLGMHQSWAKENAAFGISSNCVSPGFMPTAFHRDIDERLIEDMTARHPLKKLLEPAEVANLVADLCAASPQLNGQNIRIG
jgi:NAD(P)-dependent dehydrogenase (short-subunit alcohol dehydrogenase family)